ncbi:MAG: hypothetical protein JWM41_2913 [Gemmatimonadetes bacterium]|nr:hypothetical protein [Gemmatimonadota bacterium]
MRHASPMTEHFARPTSSRGFLPLIMAALGVGRAITGAIQGNQQKQRTKGYINSQYGLASERLNTNQRNAGESERESLNARGLLGGGVGPVHAALASGAMPGATDLAGGALAQQARQFQLERSDLDTQHDYALKENNANYINTLIGSAASGIGSAASLYGDVKGLQDANAAGDAASVDRIGSQPIPGVQVTPSSSGSVIRTAMNAPRAQPDPLATNSWGGIHPTDPLNHPSSNWYTGKKTTTALGQPNAMFNTSSEVG